VNLTYNVNLASILTHIRSMRDRKGLSSIIHTGERDAQRIRDIRSHNCKLAGCGPVCTFGDW
jgi:hypothetical protein